MSEYPEHDKLRALKDTKEAVTDFLEHLESKGRVICTYVSEETCNYADEWGECEGGTLYPFDANEEARDCRWCRGEGVAKVAPHYSPTHESIPTMLADFLKIDQNKLEEEKRAMLKLLRAQND